MLFGTGIVGLIITAIVICLVYFLLKLLIDQAPFIPANAKVWLGYLLLVLVVLWIICVILGLAGIPLHIH